MFKDLKIYFSAIILSLLLTISFSNASAQGRPPVQKSVSSSGPDVRTTMDDPGPMPAPLDSNAIYFLLAAGLFYLFYANRKKLVTSNNKFE